MNIPPATTRRKVLAVAIPALAAFVGLQFGCIQPQVLLPARPDPVPVNENVSVLITIGPPLIPLYEQPDIPDEGYIWTPGYWAWGGDGYFWVPGTWVMAPEIGLLWTPGYWGWGGRTYVFHAGYWGPHVGFYGGVNYGHGYGGSGFDGGHWQGRNFAYNRAVTNVRNPRITHVYSNTVIVNNSNVAYNGGEGGLRAAPTPQDQSAEKERRLPLTQEQQQHHQRASQDKELRASTNRGKPSVAAPSRPAAPEPGPSREPAPPNRGQAEAPRPEQSRQPTGTPAARPAAERPAIARPAVARPAAARPAPEQRPSQPVPGSGRQKGPARPDDPADPNSPYYLPPRGKKK